MRSNSRPRLGLLVSIRTLWTFACPVFLITALPASSWALCADKPRCQTLRRRQSLQITYFVSVAYKYF